MADNNSRLFVPPVSRVPDEDAMVVRVGLDKTTHGARKSQTGQRWDNSDLSPKHISNSR